MGCGEAHAGGQSLVELDCRGEASAKAESETIYDR